MAVIQAVLFTLPAVSVISAIALPLDTSFCNALDGTTCAVDSLDDRVESDMSFQLLQTGTKFQNPAELEFLSNPAVPAVDAATSILAAFDSNRDGMMSFEELRQGFQTSRKKAQNLERGFW